MLNLNPSLAEKVKKTSARWNPLRKVDTLGQFDFNTCIVMLDSLQEPSVRGISLSDLKSEEKIDVVTNSRLTKALALAVHEYTHFVDSTSTLWGLRHLRTLHRAFTCNLTDEYKLHVMRTCYTHLKRMKLPDYYTTVSKEFTAEQPWQWRATSGREFRADGKPSERPIFFVRFFNKDGQAIVRSPISPISLLETTAMAAELDAAISLLNRIQDEDERTVQTRIFEKQTMEYLYNENLTEYSVCAHIVGNHFQIKDAGVAFRASAVIARVVLNSSGTVYKTVLKNIKVFFDFMGLSSGHAEAKAIRRGLGNNDPGALFYVLCMRMEGSLNSFPRFGSTLITTLALFDVHYKRDFEASAIEEAGAIFKEIGSSPIETIVAISTAGFENFNNTIGSFGLMDLHEMNLPPVLLGDSTQYKFRDTAGNRLNGLELDESYLEMLDGQLKMEAFGDACL